MDAPESIVDYRELIGKVRRLCAEGRTGTVFITTSNNHAARLGLRGGLITSVVFRQQTGVGALAAIKRITGARVTYSTDVVEQAPQDLPSTRDLLTILDVTAARADEELSPAAASVGATLTRARAVIEFELAEYLGPMARLVLDEQLARAAQGHLASVNEAIDSLARELGDTAKAARFKERVRGRLAADIEARR